MKRAVLLAMLLAAMPAAAQICIVGKEGCKDIASGRVYEPQDGAYLDPETREVKIPPAREAETAQPRQPKGKPSDGGTRVKVKLRKIP